MYNIAIAFDNQSDYSIVLIKNIVKKSEKNQLKFLIFINNITEFDWHERWLVKNEINYELFRINSSDLGGMKIDKNKYKHISDASFYRLLMPSILSHISCFLYLDTDIYINFDIREIFSYCSENKALTVASNGNGFNSGVLLINTKEFNLLLPLDKSIKLFNEHQFAGDNDLLEYYFQDYKCIGTEYNASPYEFLIKSRFKRINLSEYKIVHFMGTIKPWRYSTILPFAKEWRELYFDIYGRKPWIKVSFKEFIMRILYILFPNPSVLFKIHGFLRNYLRK